jgi:hypothetical protein
MQIDAVAHARGAARSVAVQRCALARSRAATRHARTVRVRADSGAAPALSGSNESLISALSNAIAEVQQLPPSQRKDGATEASKTVKAALQALKSQNGVVLYDSYSGRTMRRNVRAPGFANPRCCCATMRWWLHGCATQQADACVPSQVMAGELRQIGIKEPEVIGVPSVRNDAAFLAAVVGGSSVLALVLGQLPGDWGFFGMYLSGGISILVLAIGSTAPGLLQIPINAFSSLFPDFRDRVLRHEAAHFLIAYLLGVPIVDYSLDISSAHTDLLEYRLQRKLVGAQRLSDDEIDALAVIAMAGVAAEATVFPEVTGQTADLSALACSALLAVALTNAAAFACEVDLQRMLNRSASPLAANTQQNITRWAVWQAAVMLRANAKAYEELREAMSRRASVADCILAIERGAAADKAALAK